MKSLIIVSAAVLALTAGVCPAAAQVPAIGADGKAVLAPDDPAEAPMCPTPVSIRAHQDAVTVKKIDEAFHREGYSALMAYMSELEDVVAHAPASLSKFDRCPGHVEMHGATFDDYRQDLVDATKGAKPGEKTAASWQPWPYPHAFLLIGSYYTENEKWSDALPVLQKGLDLAPLDPDLVTETALTLDQFKHFDEALALCDRALAENTTMTVKNRARVMRCRGFALSELDRLDEAEKAYQDSLTLQPGNPTALNELKYLANLRAGKGKTPSGIVNSGTGKPNDPK